MEITTEGLAGLAFPVVKVRYAGPTNTRGSRWIATLSRGGEKTRVALPYRSELPGGAVNALPAAQACFAKVRAAIDATTDPSDWVAIPGDPDSSTYVFTFVPADYLRSES